MPSIRRIKQVYTHRFDSASISETVANRYPFFLNPSITDGSASAECHPRPFMCMITIAPGFARESTIETIFRAEICGSGSPVTIDHSTVRIPSL